MSTFGGFGGFGTATTSAAPSGSLFGATSTPSFSGFGTGTSTKSVTFNQQPAGTSFGGFGTAAPASAPAAGFGFGAPASTAATGFSFGAPASTAATGFGFGTPASTTATGFGFGAPASTAATGFSFGTPASTAATGFGFGAPAPAAATGFGFGAPASSANTGFSFGTPAPSVGTGFGFGAPASTAGTGFGFGAPAPAAGFGFGGTALPVGTGFSFGKFGSGATAIKPGTGAPGFGVPGDAAGFGQQQQQQQQTPALYSAMLNVSIYGDERDAILTKWNQLQAKWGVGKGFYSAEAAPADFGPDNPFCLMKAVGYARLPTAKNEHGLVVMRLNKKEADVRAGQQQMVDAVSVVLGTRASLSVCVDMVRSITPEKCEVHIYVQERNPNGSVRRVPASDLCAHLSAPAQRAQLASLALDDLCALVAPSSDQLQLYLDNPPAGIDKLIWEQAKKDNPDPKLMIPVPMIGFQELHRRTQCQEQENTNQQRRLSMIASDICDLQKTQATTAARLSQLKRANLELSHRILQVLVRQEVLRKQGWSIQPHEERLRVQLEALQDELATPTQFKGRLNELLSQTRLQSQQAVQRGERYSMDPAGQDEVRQLLRAQQDGLQQLIAVIHTDVADLQVIQDGLEHAPRR